MAIVKMKKFTSFAFEEKKEELLKRLQKFGEVQFQDLQTELENEDMGFLKSAAVDKDILDIEAEILKITFSLDFLKPYIKKPTGLQALRIGKKSISFEELEKSVKDINWIKIYEDLKQKEEKQNILNNEKTKLNGEIESLIPWKNFDAKLEELKALKISQYYIGSIPTGPRELFIEEFEKTVDYSYVEIINENKDETYLLIVTIKNKENEVNEMLKKYGFTKANINHEGKPSELISSMKDRILEIEKEKDTIMQGLGKLDSYQNDLELVYEYYYNQLTRAKAGLSFLKSSTVVAIQGWVTEDKSKELENIIKSVTEENYYIEIEDIKDGEYVPILLKNNGFVESFESIVGMYSLPNYGEVDPTPIMSVFYLIFFGMMLSDAGYGLIMVIATTITLKFFNIDDNLKKSVKLFLYLGISTIVWGSIYGSWFGDAPQSIFGLKVKALVNPSNDIMFILGVAVVMGVVHIFIGLAMKGYILIRAGKILDVIYDVLLWYITLIGIFLLLSGVGGSIGKIMTIAGCVGLILTQGRDAKTIGGKIGGGIYGLYGITSYIGDIVSYSRLLALGLATGFIANAFNLMVTIIPAGPMRLILGTILFLGGHIFNLGINALGSYVHASRLQYLEFFNKFYEGGGKRFSPLKSENKFIDVTNK